VPVNKGELTRLVKAEAQRLGFELVGVTTPDPPPHVAFYEAWLGAGYHGEMAYLAKDRARQRRREPRTILPDCRSILVLGVRYPNPDSLPSPPEPEDSTRTPQGKIASYAWGTDYHDLLPGRLQSLLAFIEAQVGHPIPHRAYTDTGPLLERDLAQRAGLGWVGKNTCLIHPRHGSYFLLAELLLEIELEPDSPFEADHCGSCTRCLEACPTTCILPNRTLDASRCISYLTIELKGAVPLDLRHQVAEWVFGCDVCQQVCPWNQRFATQAGDPELRPRPGIPAPDLLEELELTPEDFNRKLKGSPVKRTKRRGYLRNVAVALGNSGDPRAVPVLANALQHDPEPLVRGHAAWALGQIGGVKAEQVLQHALQVETEPTVIEEIKGAASTINLQK